MSPEEYSDWFKWAKRLGLSFADEPAGQKDFMEDMGTVLYMVEYERWLKAHPPEDDEENPDGG